MYALFYKDIPANYYSMTVDQPFQATYDRYRMLIYEKDN